MKGISPAAIDRVATDFGMPMGPIRLADTVGLDICLSVATILSRHFAVEVPEKLRGMVAAGHLGRKSGQGFYNYTGATGSKNAGDGGVHEEIESRMMLRLLNEAVACWREQVVNQFRRVGCRGHFRHRLRTLPGRSHAAHFGPGSVRSACPSERAGRNAWQQIYAG